jgi:HEAT repeat protein
MTDEQGQSNKGRVDDIPEASKRVIRELHLAIRQASLYPPGHPVRVKAGGEVYESLQEVLSSQESHSLTAIGDRLYVDQHKTSVDEQRHTALDEVSADFARKLRRRGIRSVVFSRGIELPELERFLDIMTMEAREVMAQGGAGNVLRLVSDVPHVEIVDIEYESTQFVTDDGKEDLMDLEEMLVSFLEGTSKDLPDEAYTYLLSLLERPDLMARLIENCTYDDDTHEPDSSMVEQCMNNLISLGEQLTDEERKDFQRKILEATLQMETPVKNIVFSVSVDRGTVADLMDGLSVDEIARLVTEESATGEPTVALWGMFDGLLTSDQSHVPGSPEERLAKVEAAIQDELVEKGQEDVFANTIAPILEEVFVELQVGRLENEQLELEQLLDEARLPEQRQEMGDRADEMTDILAAEDDVVNSAVILMEMLESETDSENYLDIAEQLEEVAKFLIMGSEDTMHVRDEYLMVAFRIMDVLSGQADVESGKSPELQERAREAISSIGTEEIIDRVIWSSLRAIGAMDASPIQWDMLERFVRQVGERTAIPALVKNLLDAENPPERHKLGEILTSIGPTVVPQLRKRLPQVQWDALIKDIMPILSKIGGAEVLDYFADAVNHPNPQVRRSAITGLAKDGSPGVMKLILDKVWDEKEEESIRQLAISVLGEMRFAADAKNNDEQVVEEMERVIKGKDAAVKREAIYALGNIGGERSILILSDLLKQKRLILGRRRLEGLQLYAVEALRQIGTQSAIEVLKEMSQKKKGNVKSACDEALEGL